MRNFPDIIRNKRSPILDLMSEFDEIFQEAFRQPFLRSVPKANNTTEKQWFQPEMDLEETETAYVLAMDLPGVRSEDVKIDLDGQVLSITGERRREIKLSAHTGAQHSERAHGRFQRRLSLPENIEKERIEAHFQNGVLHVAIPKQAVSQARQIQIQSGKESGAFLKRFFGASPDSKTDTETDTKTPDMNLKDVTASSRGPQH